MNTITIELAKECGIEIGDDGEPHWFYVSLDQLEAFAEKIRADERERCAKVCDDLDIEFYNGPKRMAAEKCAISIRNMTAGGE